MSVYAEVLILLFTVVTVIWLFRKLKLPAILAYLVSGMIVGEHGFAWVIDHVNYEHFAEIGIVFLLFTLGLEFSMPQLVAMRHLVFGIGFFQTLLTAAIFAAIAVVLGQTLTTAMIIGSIFALSSTAIVIKQLTENGGIKRKSGQISVAVLLFQDIAVVPFLIVIPLLAQGSGAELMTSLAFALIKGVVIVAILMFLGKKFLPFIFNAIAKTKTSELFVLTTLLVTLVAAVVTQAFGLSMALGAFLAGMMLSESQYKYQLEADIRPYRDILLGLFFVTVGMKLDIQVLIDYPLQIIGFLLLFIIIKVLIVKLLVHRAGESPKDAWASGFMLAQMGEFGFVLIALALQYQLLNEHVASMILVVGVLSMLLTPFLIDNARQWAVSLTKEQYHPQSEPEQQAITESLADHVVICGFGRVGQTVSRFLREEKIPYVAIDIDPLRVKESMEAGEPVLFGSSRQREILSAAKIERAKLLVVAFGEDKQSIEVIHKARSLNSTIDILVRTRSDENLTLLKEAGANEVVPEVLEGSLMLVSQVLSLTGVPLSRIIKNMQKERESHYSHMHGFYQGENTNLSPEKIDKIQFAHAVLMTNGAFAIEKSLAQLLLNEKEVDVLSINNAEGVLIESPDENYMIHEGDSIVLRGKPRQVELAERYLLEGE